MEMFGSNIYDMLLYIIIISFAIFDKLVEMDEMKLSDKTMTPPAQQPVSFKYFRNNRYKTSLHNKHIKTSNSIQNFTTISVIRRNGVFENVNNSTFLTFQTSNNNRVKKSKRELGDLESILVSLRMDKIPAVVKRSNKTNFYYPRRKFATTRNFKELFLGRCFEYQFQNEGGSNQTRKQWDCGRLWDALFQSFAYKPACDVKIEDYRTFLGMLEENVPVNKGLLWSGSRELTHALSDFFYKKRYTTLEDTLAGFLLNKLSWCGMENDPGINFKECPWECSIQSPYWSLANQKFAQELRGTVHIILNGTRWHLDDKNVYPSFMKDRYYLGPYILPELNKEKITKIIVIVAHSLHRTPLENCWEKSVLTLLNAIQLKGIPVECYNDTNVIKHVLCLDEPDEKWCNITG